MDAPPPKPIHLLNPGQKILDRYRLVRKIGKGSSGQVWLAEQTHLNNQVVIKFPLFKRGKDFDEQFGLELKTLVEYSNRHPNIINILDAGEYNKCPFLVTQFLNRGSLEQFVAGRIGAKTPEGKMLHKDLSWVAQIAEALDFIHSKNLIHRDVKPANILLDESMSAYLADFGLAENGTESAVSKKLAGTWAYTPPEVLEKNRFSPASDQFSFSVSIYEFLYGTRPFRGSDFKTILESQRNWPGKKQALRGRSVLEFFERAFSLEPGKRFGNCVAAAQNFLESYRNRVPNPAQVRMVEKPPIPSPIELAPGAASGETGSVEESPRLAKTSRLPTDTIAPRITPPIPASSKTVKPPLPIPEPETTKEDSAATEQESDSKTEEKKKAPLDRFYKRKK